MLLRYLKNSIWQCNGQNNATNELTNERLNEELLSYKKTSAFVKNSTDLVGDGREVPINRDSSVARSAYMDFHTAGNIQYNHNVFNLLEL